MVQPFFREIKPLNYLTDIGRNIRWSGWICYLMSVSLHILPKLGNSDDFELDVYGKYNIDYIDDIENSTRKEEIVNMESEFPIKLFEVAGPNKVRFIDNTWKLKNLLFSRVKSTIQEIDVVSFLTVISVG